MLLIVCCVSVVVTVTKRYLTDTVDGVVDAFEHAVFWNGAQRWRAS